MEALKAEIAKKRKQLEDKHLLVSNLRPIETSSNLRISTERRQEIL